MSFRPIIALCVALVLAPVPMQAQPSAGKPPEASLFGHPVRVVARPDRAIAPRLTGSLVLLTSDSLVLKADSVQLITARDDSTRKARITCGSCVEARLALADLARVEVASVPPPDAWKRTRRRGVLWGALVGGAGFAGVQAARGGSGVVGAAVAGSLLGAWLGGTIGAGWPQRQEWRVVYEAPGER